MEDGQTAEQQEEVFVPPSNESLFDGEEAAVVAHETSGGEAAAPEGDKGDEQQAATETKEEKVVEAGDGVVTEEQQLDDDSPKDPEKSGIYHDLKKERTKRQALETELEELRAKNPAQAAEEGGADVKKNFWDDPDKSVADIKANTAVEVHKANFKIYARFGKEKHGDEKFNAAFSEFAAMSKVDSSLFQKMSEADDPAEYIYQTGKQSIGIKEIGDPAAYKQKLKEELKKEILAEMTAEKGEGAKPEAKDPPESLSTVSSKAVDDQNIVAQNTAEDLYD